MVGRYRGICLVLVFLTFMGLNGLVQAAQAEQGDGRDNPNYQVFAFNDLGMHCYDKDFSVFSLLPLFNVIHGQVVKKGLKPTLLTDAEIKLTYAATADPSGSINTTSIGKTNFWNFIAPLFGPNFTNWPFDTGILGAKMPDLNFGPEPLSYDAAYKWFSATGIPLTNIDDHGNLNCFSMMKIRAVDKKTKIFRDSLDIVVPASSEMNCAACHETAAYVIDGVTACDASPPPRLTTLAADDFSNNPDPQVRFRENILILHDALSGTNLVGQYNGGNGSPILCAQCHYSKALDLAGNNQPTGDQVGHLYLSRAMHKHHGTAWPMMDSTYVIPIPGAYTPDAGPSECYYCHPGNDTQCLRSAMAVKGMSCQNCHGDLLAVGGFTPQLAVPGVVDKYLPNVNDPTLTVNLTTTGQQRRPWQDMPKCQSCHSGDALNHLGASIVGTQTYDSNDPASTPFNALNQRFAENPGQIFRFSSTHGGLACESCHGSPHCEWPARINSNDNITATQIQGHTGEIAECGACHLNGLKPGLGGPHGLHNVNDPTWLARHGVSYRNDHTSCQSCHGADLKGTVLSKAKAYRKLRQSCQTGNGGNIAFAKGTPVNCYSCHNRIR